MEPAAILNAIRALLQDQPDINDTNQFNLWVGRSQAIAAKVDMMRSVEIGSISSYVFDKDPEDIVYQINAVLYKALAEIELKAPVQQQGTFIQAGNELDAFAGASKVLRTASNSVRIVDPYMDEVVVTDYAVLLNEGVAIQLLSDKATVKPSFAPAVSRFKKQFTSSRPLEARLTAARILHDRLIFIDDRVVYTVSQSLKDLAKRSHASIIKSLTQKLFKHNNIFPIVE